ncbi:hypothetical protein [Sphingobacterium spiritivorum]|uniref:Uncharacterized protein n=1 Tax=Sphingobacterium spiritivorum ATCC 33861 TaxID=525373 RepID=D7VQD2_SPHSI|nr:hypothetical protein [Sphingobacterium spiritivorum]EFK55983.1 hypothetical protein HMPREF0766_13186 [Sphingobacterium spiritivorum ATCC 33861]QQT35884.1 hypothetical protein I6J01_00220 [Sphingobacterium spiritivorum]WQD32611.1 hypothetical protein U0038_13920 [Sphingobacterium spiritivorum]SUJ11633.1 Uncharacterised protein [Sphingobacterium spiritivorum]
MIFKRVSYQILSELKAKGFNLLVSDHTTSDKTPIYFPLKVENVQSYVLKHFDRASEKLDRASEKLCKIKLMLLIDEVLMKYDEERVCGVIQLE